MPIAAMVVPLFPAGTPPSDTIIVVDEERRHRRVLESRIVRRYFTQVSCECPVRCVSYGVAACVTGRLVKPIRHFLRSMPLETTEVGGRHIAT